MHWIVLVQKIGRFTSSTTTFRHPCRQMVSVSLERDGVGVRVRKRERVLFFDLEILAVDWVAVQQVA